MIWMWVTGPHGETNSDIDKLAGQEMRLTDAWRFAIIEALEKWLNDLETT